MAGCGVAGAATLGRLFGTRTMARARSVISTAFDPDLPRIPESVDSHRMTGSAYQSLPSPKPGLLGSGNRSAKQSFEVRWPIISQRVTLNVQEG